MKKFAISIVIFLVLCFAMDRAFGFAARYLYNNAISGQTAKIHHIADLTDEDILIFGSSRGAHHYDPRIIEDSLQMTCYNCAYDGCGIITAYGLLLCVTEHYTPKVIIYDIMPSFDYLEQHGESNGKYLGVLKNLYDREGLDSLFFRVAPEERIKMNSEMYRINSKLVQLVTENMMERNTTIQGYLPVNRKMAYEPTVTEDDLPGYDEVKQYYFHRFIDLCKEKGISLILAASPIYKKPSDIALGYARDIASQNGIPFINHYCNPELSNNSDNFYDSGHMNAAGAEAYTKVIAGELRGIIGGN